MRGNVHFSVRAGQDARRTLCRRSARLHRDAAFRPSGGEAQHLLARTLTGAIQRLGQLKKKDLTEPVAEYGLTPSGTLKEDLLAALTTHAPGMLANVTAGRIANRLDLGAPTTMVPQIDE
ncbi:hypothetical protein ACH4S9_32840 [Streptomyces sp. NPDC021225]|uniref:hypothetical protein n=1 Tax=Streptomyces sp. NPDC021225 TaxID=3365121 RepID=UPI0037A13781